MGSRQQTSRHYTMFLYYFFYLIKQYVCITYSLFVFRFYYKIIGLSFFNVINKLAGRGLTCLWSVGMGTCGPGRGQTLTVWVGLGPKF